jgi:hypothetical protein
MDVAWDFWLVRLAVLFAAGVIVVLLATDQAKNNIGMSIDGFSGDYERAKKSALRLAQTTKFEYSSNYSLNYLTQTLSGKARDMYIECLEKDKERPGLAIWLDRREGDYFFLNAFWVGDEGQAYGEYDPDYPVSDSINIVAKPKNWPKGSVKEIVFKKNPNSDGFFSLSVSGKAKSYIAVHDPIPVKITNHEVLGPTLRAQTAHTGGQCEGGGAIGCVTPQKPGGFLVPGSGHLNNFSAALINAAGFSATFDTPDQICIRLYASTGDCRRGNVATGTVAAIESYPEAAEHAQ